MKKVFIFAAAACLSASLFATNPINTNKALTTQIYALLQNLPLEIEEELQAEIKFYIDTENRLQILKVQTEDPYVRKVLRKRLDDKLLAGMVTQNNVYKLPLIIKL